MKRIFIHADERIENGSRSASTSVVEKDKITIQGIFIEDGDKRYDFSFEDLMAIGEIISHFKAPLFKRIRGLSDVAYPHNFFRDG